MNAPNPHVRARPHARAANPRAAGRARRGAALVKVLVLLGVLAGAAGGGYLVARSFAAGAQAAPAENPAGAGSTAGRRFVEFGTLVVNLAEPRLTRYLKVTITLEVTPKTEQFLARMTSDGRDALFKDWLVSHLSDKQLDDVKGTGAINRLRRELVEGFNRILQEFGDYQVEQVLFTELNVT